MEKSLVSIIIPVYNVEKYLRQCLDSVLNQTYKNYEVIMVDDGSTDSSGKICDEYCDKDNRFYVIHRENGGLSVARNTGFEVSKGEYVYFMDSDDWIEQVTLEKLIHKAEETKADFVFFDGKSFEDSEKGYNIKQGYTRKKEYSVDSGINVFDDLQRNGDFHFPVQMYFYRKSFLDKHQMKFYPGILYEDVVFSFEAFCCASIASHCHEELYHRRFREGSIVTTKLTKKNFTSSCIAFDEVVKTATDTGFLSRESVIAYIARVGMRPIDIYSQLSSTEKAVCSNEYKGLIKGIKEAKGYGDKALYYRTYGKLPWMIYKAFRKITRR